MVVALNTHCAVVLGNSGSLEADMRPNDQYREAMYWRVWGPCSKCCDGSQWLSPNAVSATKPLLSSVGIASLDAKLNQTQPRKWDSMKV
jgi:hypothetical protein